MMNTDNTWRYQTMKQGTSYNYIYSISNGNLVVGKKMKTF